MTQPDLPENELGDAAFIVPPEQAPMDDAAGGPTIDPDDDRPHDATAAPAASDGA